MLTTFKAAVETLRMAGSGLRPIVLLERSDPADPNACTFADKVLAVQSAGAAAAVVFDYMDEGPVAMTYASPADVVIPAVFIGHGAGELLLASLQGGAQPLALLQPLPRPNDGANPASTALG